MITVSSIPDRKLEITARWAKHQQEVAKRPTLDARSTGSSCGGRIPGEDSRQDDMELSRIHELNRILVQAKRAPVPTSNDVVCIDHVVTLSHRPTTGHASHGKTEHDIEHIVGFEEGECKANPQRISYETPLARSLLGCERGDYVDVWYEGRFVRKKIIRIETLEQYKKRIQAAA